MTGPIASIHIEIAAASRTPIRRHVAIPQGDQLTQDWFDIQKNQSASVRLLIADEIRKYGMVDRVARERYGTPLAQAAARAAGRTQPQASTAQPASGPATAAQAAASVPPSWSVPLLDPREAEIQRLQSELDALRAAAGPYADFLDGLERDGVDQASPFL